jgi:peptide/nickel transport system permease protein
MATATTSSSVAKLDVKRRDTGTGESLTQLALRRLRKDYLTLIAIGVLLVLAILSMLAGPISEALGVSHTRTNAARTFLTIGSPGHVLGTDDLGRDHLSRLLHAGQVSLGVGFMAAMLSLSIGLTLGISTGYFGGIFDDLVNWLISTLNSVPQLFLLLIVAAVLRPNATTLILVLGFLGWTGTCRLVRGETLSLREREFVVSARAVGASAGRIMFVHILPNLFSVIVVTLAIDIGSVILAEAGLSFLGLGIQEPVPSWGNMLTKSQTFFNKGVHLVILPGLLIFLTVLCLYIIGDGIRDAFDPTAKD